MSFSTTTKSFPLNYKCFYTHSWLIKLAQFIDIENNFVPFFFVRRFVAMERMGATRKHTINWAVQKALKVINSRLRGQLRQPLLVWPLPWLPFWYIASFVFFFFDPLVVQQFFSFFYAPVSWERSFKVHTRAIKKF